MPAPVVQDATSRGDTRYDVRGYEKIGPRTWRDDAGYTYTGDDPSSVLADNRPNPAPTGKSGGGGGGGGGIPGGAAIAQMLALAKQAYESAFSKITNKRQSLARESGFTFDIDQSTGVMKSMRVDPHSIYGTYQLLNRQQAQRDENARAVAIERGLGAGGGLAAQLRSNSKFQSGQEDALFASTLTDKLTDLASQQQEAKHAYDAAKYQAELERARMAALSSYGGSGGGGGSAPADDSSGFIFTPEGNLDNTGLDINSARAEMNDLRRRAMPRPKPKPVRTNYNPNLPMGIQRR